MASNRRLSYIRAGYEQRNSVANSNYFGYEKYGALGIREIMTEKSVTKMNHQPFLSDLTPTFWNYFQN